MAGEEPNSGGTGATTRPLSKSPSRPQLDLSGASIQGSTDDKSLGPAIVLPNQCDELGHFAIDIGGVRTQQLDGDDPIQQGFSRPGSQGVTIASFCQVNVRDDFRYKRTARLYRIGYRQGGGALKYAAYFKERLGLIFEKEDEMDSLVAGANFLLRMTFFMVWTGYPLRSFTHMEGQKNFVQIDYKDLFPYLLVNIGSGVSILKVDGEGSFERVSGISLGGGTVLGLGWLLMKCKTFDEILELSQKGDNSSVDMLVGDIYGGDYSKIGLSASTIASSFGKVAQEIVDLSEYKREDIALSLLRMTSYVIGQIAHGTATHYGLKRIFFGGFFIRSHAITMDTISIAIKYWSKGEAQAMFLRHEGYLGALGAFLTYDKHDLTDLTSQPLGEISPICSNETQGPSIGDLEEELVQRHVFH